MSQTRPLQIVLDTNVLLSALRSRDGTAYHLLNQLGTEKWQANVSTHLILEYEEILKREMPDLVLSLSDIDNFLDVVCNNANKYPDIFFAWQPVANDADDDFIINLAVRCNADAIVTFNVRHLLPARQFGIDVLKPRDFLRKLEETR